MRDKNVHSLLLITLFQLCQFNGPGGVMAHEGKKYHVYPVMVVAHHEFYEPAIKKYLPILRQRNNANSPLPPVTPHGGTQVPDGLVIIAISGSGPGFPTMLILGKNRKKWMVTMAHQ